MTKRNYEYFLLDTKDNSVFQGLLSCLIYFPTPYFLKIEICSLFLFLNGFSVKWPRCAVHTLNAPVEFSVESKSHCRMLADMEMDSESHEDQKINTGEIWIKKQTTKKKPTDKKVNRCINNTPKYPNNFLFVMCFPILANVGST